MTDKEIFVLDGEHANALPIVQSLGQAGYRVSLAGATLSGPAFFSRYPSRMMEYPDPFQNKAGFQDWIGQLSEKSRSGILFPVTDKTIHPLMELKICGQLSMAAFLPEADSFSKIFNKQETMALARECGIPFPRTILIHSQEDLELASNLSFPCFAKSAISKVWKENEGYDLSAQMIRNREELSDMISRITKYCPLLVQEYVPGKGVGVELLCDKGEVILEFAHRRVHELPLTGGGSSYRVSIGIPEPLLEASKNLLGRIGWHGLAMVEFKCEGNRFWLMEVNGRVWGSMPLAISAGVDFPRGYAELLLEKKSSPAPVGPRLGLYQRKVFRDIVWFRDNLKADKTDTRLHTRPVFRTSLEWFRILWGKDRWDSFSLTDPGPFLYELKGLKESLLRKFGARISLQKERSRARRFLIHHPPSRILVLCYGNICRSPYAERRLRMSLPSSVEIRSAGFYPEPNRSSPLSYMGIVAERGIDLGSHHSSLVDSALMEWADVVLIMDHLNWRQVQGLEKKYLEKTVWLGAWGTEESEVEIEDPFGKNREKTQEILARLDKACQGFSEAFQRISTKSSRPARVSSPRDAPASPIENPSFDFDRDP